MITVAPISVAPESLTMTPFQDNFSTEAIVDPADFSDEDGISGRKYYLTICYIFTSCLGVTGNLLVVVVIFHFTTMRKQMANMFIINQSIVDTIVSVLTIAKYAYDYTFNYDQSAHGSDILCRLWSSEAFLWSAFNVSTYNLIAVTLERYMKVVHPITHRNHFTKTKALVAIAAVWVWGVGFTLLTTVPTTKITYGFCWVWSAWPSDQWRKAMGVVNAVITFFAPVAIMVYCYSHMILALYRRNDRLAVVAPAMNQEGPTANKGKQPSKLSRAQKNLVKTLLIVAICFVLCWTWNQIFFLLWNLGYISNWNDTLWGYDSSVVMVFVNSCINPFIYLFKYDEFRKGLRKLLPVGKDPHVSSFGTTSGNTGHSIAG